MFLASLLALIGGCPKPTGGGGGGGGGDEPCCVIGEGPWHVKVGLESGGTPTEVGRVWALQQADANGNYSEFAERKQSGWAWLDATHYWLVSVPQTDTELDHCGDTANGYDTCVKLLVAPTNAPHPLQTYIASAPDQGELATTTSSDYHAEGKYQITVKQNNSTVGTGWFYTKASGTKQRDEVFCMSSDPHWPSRSSPATTWEIHRTGDPGTLPTNTDSCPAGARAWWGKDTLSF